MRRPEQQLHLAVARYLDLMLRPQVQDSPVFWTAIDHASGVKNGRLAGALRKARGVKAGLPDIMIFGEPLAATPNFTPVAAIELKAGKGTQSPAQKQVQAAMEAVGIHYAICRSIEDVGQVLVKLGLAF